VEKKKMLDWKFFILLLLILVVIVIVAVVLFKIVSTMCMAKKNSSSSVTTSEFYDSSSKPSLDVLYATYLNQIWPLTSNIHVLPGTLNLDFSETNTVRYFAMLDPSTSVLLMGNVPQPCAYWSLVLYNNQGGIHRTFTDSDFASGSYNITLSNNGTPNATPVPRDGNYAVVITVLQTDSTPPLYPSFLPRMTIIPLSSSTVDNSTPTPSPNAPLAIPVILQQQIINSQTVQKLFTTSLATNDRSSNTVFPGIQVTQFFLPMRSTILPFLPDPNMIYLMAFADTARVIKITGTLPGSLRSNTPFRDATIIAGDFVNTSTSASYTMTAADAFFIIYAAYSTSDAALYGYDPDPVKKQKLLIWDPSTIKPVVLLRYTYAPASSFSPVVVQTATGFSSMTPSLPPSPLSILSSMDASSKTIGPDEVKNAMGSAYPTATSYQIGSLPPSQPPASSTGLGFTAGAPNTTTTNENFYYPSSEKHPSGMPYMNMTSKMLQAKSMSNQQW
jgi:hypothetical protein